MALKRQAIGQALTSLVLALLMTLLPWTEMSAQPSATITITATGAYEISLDISPGNWNPAGGGAITPNTEYATNTAYFTLTVGGNCAVNTYISASNATWVKDGKVDTSYQWNLSADGQNGLRTYALWFKLDSGTDYTLITTSPGEFYASTLVPGETKQFGLKLLTPQPDFTKDGSGYFSVGAATIRARVIISAIAATS